MSNDPIKKIYQEKLSMYTIPEEGGEWLELDKKLSRAEFWRFKFEKFNIYYVVAIISSIIALSLIIFFTSINKSGENFRNTENALPSPVKPPEKQVLSDSLRLKNNNNYKSVADSFPVKKEQSLPPEELKDKKKYVITKDDGIEKKDSVVLLKKMDKDALGKIKTKLHDNPTQEPSDSVKNAIVKDRELLIIDSTNSKVKTVIKKKVIKKIYQPRRDTIYEVDSVKVKSKNR